MSGQGGVLFVSMLRSCLVAGFAGLLLTHGLTSIAADAPQATTPTPVPRHFAPPEGMVLLPDSELFGFAQYATLGMHVVAVMLTNDDWTHLEHGEAIAMHRLVLIKESNDVGSGPETPEHFSASYQDARDEAHSSDDHVSDGASAKALKRMCQQNHIRCPEVTYQGAHTQIVVDEPMHILIRSAAHMKSDGQAGGFLLASGNFLVDGRRVQVSVMEKDSSAEDEAWFENQAITWEQHLHVVGGAIEGP